MCSSESPEIPKKCKRNFTVSWWNLLHFGILGNYIKECRNPNDIAPHTLRCNLRKIM